MQHRQVAVNGLNLHCVTAGNMEGDAPLMVFVHGFPEFWYAWHKQLEDFCSDYRVLAFDQRGHNLSDKPEAVEAYKARHLVEDLRQLIAHFQADRIAPKCILVAHDWGGAIAWNFAVAHPEYLTKLVIINAPHPVPYIRALAHDPKQQQTAAYMLRLRRSDAEEFCSANNYAELLNMFVTATGANALTSEEMTLYREAWSKPGALTAALNLYRASPLYPPDGDDPGAAKLKINPAQFIVRVPTLVIWGDKDHAMELTLLDGLSDVVIDLRIEHIAAGSHWVIHEFPAQVNTLIRHFISASLELRVGNGA